MMGGLTIVLTTLNEERNIDRCLSSCRWADEIIVVDSFSTDATIEKARQYTSKVLQHEYPGSSRQVEWGVQQATNEWVFYIDADEEIPAALAAELQNVVRGRPDLPANVERPAGYDILRKSQAFGKWIMHGGWYPDYTFRLFRKDRYTVNHQEVHGGFSVKGARGRIDSPMYHYTYDHVFSYVAKMNDYTSLQVSNKLRDNPHVRSRWYNILVNPALHFVKMFFFKKGWRDGWHGFMLAILDAQYTLLLYMKMKEHELRSSDGSGTLPPVTNAQLNKVKRSR
jgi:glycosyltransferase involved in cell wall biosynthesis